MGASARELTPGEVLRAYAGAFVDELARAGVTEACICPGSRSTPLAMLLREHPGIRTWMHLDERSASFFALGMAKASRKPVAVLCTSGTAAANFLPAVVEAKYGQVPLVVLTADRPQELRDVGALQTIDQVRLYGSHAKRFDEMLLPEATPTAIRQARAAADRAVATALSPPRGPVHLNFPFREPLVPSPLIAVPEGGRRPLTAVEPPLARMPRIDIPDLIRTLRGKSKGLVVCGPMDFGDQLGEEERPYFDIETATRLAVPVLADAFSQLRCGDALGGKAIDRFDAFLRDEATAAGLAFDYVIRIGAMPVSKPLQQFLDRNAGAVQILAAEPGTWPDASRTATHFGWGDGLEAANILVPFDVFSNYGDSGRPDERAAWNEAWRSVNETAAVEMESALSRPECMSEPLVFRRLAELVPENAIVFAGNSMPVRDLDSFWPASTKRVRFLANRGASGIDGVVSTALGASAVSDQPLVLVIGDISLYHDMNGLFAAKRHNLNATIIVLNNDGGGIFSFLPQSEQGEAFEELFGTPHGLDFRHAAGLYGLDYALTATPDEFDAAVTASLRNQGVSLIEVRTDRAENLALHRDIWAKVGHALESEREASEVR